MLPFFRPKTMCFDRLSLWAYCMLPQKKKKKIKPNVCLNQLFASGAKDLAVGKQKTVFSQYQIS